MPGRQHVNRDGLAKRSFATERAALEFTFQQPAADGQVPYRCSICERFHLAST